MAKKTISKAQFGDFQTPLELAQKVVKVLKRNHHINPDVVIEPTCGKGAFLIASCQNFHNALILGYEINPEYIKEAETSLQNISATDRVKIKQADFFHTAWNKEIADIQGFLLVIGNPPWVTSSELGLLNSTNLPKKTNFQNRKGIEAITGSANFDISEWMLLEHIKWFSNQKGALAFLCKYAVARKIMRQVKQNPHLHLFGHIYPINAKADFDVSVEACLFMLTTEEGKTDCEVYESLDSTKASHVIGERDGFMVSDVHGYEKWKHLRDQDPVYIWRTGVKHDCSKIMELEPVAGGYKNGLEEVIQCEDNYLYPLLKSSDVGNNRTTSHRKVVLVTQKKVNDDTSKIRSEAPLTWEYLISHRRYLDKRGSSIYKRKPEFAMFGIGDYTFKKWKVAISGMYKKLNFSLIGPLNGKTVMFDDTVNFLSFHTKKEAEFVLKMLTSSPAIEFLESMVFWDEKRPVTVQILRRLSIKKVAEEIGEIEKYTQLCEGKRTFKYQSKLNFANMEKAV